MLELKPCPFCGGEPDIRTRMDEDIWSHNTVEWTGVHCYECGIGFDWPPGAEPDAKEQWNTRATPATDKTVEGIARIIDPEAFEDHFAYQKSATMRKRALIATATANAILSAYPLRDEAVWIAAENIARGHAHHTLWQGLDVNNIEQFARGLADRIADAIKAAAIREGAK